MNRLLSLPAFAAVALFTLYMGENTLLAAEQPLGPRIQFKSTAFNFARVTCGETVKHDFLFTNAGNEVLEISDVKPGCGCTTAGQWARTVKPGKTGVIPLQFNSAGFGGAVTKSATVICNDAAHSNVVLSLEGFVWKPVDVSPAVVVFQPTEEDQTSETKFVRILSDLDKPLKLFDLECTDRSLKAELKTIKAGREFELNVTTIPPFGSRYASASITVKTSAAEVPLLVVPVSIAVQPIMAVIPQQILITSAPLAGALTSFVTVVNNSKADITFSAPQSNLPVLGAQFQESVPAASSSDSAAESKVLKHGQQLTLAVNFPAGFQIQPGKKIEVTLQTTHPKVPVLRVPVSTMSFPTVGNQP